MKKTIQFYTKRNYGTDHEYVVDTKTKTVVASLIRRGTIDPHVRIDLSALFLTQGVTLEWVEVPAPR